MHQSSLQLLFIITIVAVLYQLVQTRFARLDDNCEPKYRNDIDNYIKTIRELPLAPDIIQEISESIDELHRSQIKCNEELFRSMRIKFNKLLLKNEHDQREQYLDKKSQELGGITKKCRRYRRDEQKLGNNRACSRKRMQQTNDMIAKLQGNWTNATLSGVADATRYNERLYASYVSRLVETANQCIAHVNYCQSNKNNNAHLLNQINITIQSISDRWVDEYYRIVRDSVQNVLANNYHFKKATVDDILQMLTINYPHRLWSIIYFQRTGNETHLDNINNYLAHLPSELSFIGPNRVHIIIVKYEDEVVVILGSDNTTDSTDENCQIKAESAIKYMPDDQFKGNLSSSLHHFQGIIPLTDYHRHNFNAILIKWSYHLILKPNKYHQFRLINRTMNKENVQNRQYLFSSFC